MSKRTSQEPRLPTESEEVFLLVAIPTEEKHAVTEVLQSAQPQEAGVSSQLR